MEQQVELQVERQVQEEERQVQEEERHQQQLVTSTEWHVARLQYSAAGDALEAEYSLACHGACLRFHWRRNDSAARAESWSAALAAPHPRVKLRVGDVPERAAAPSVQRPPLLRSRTCKILQRIVVPVGGAMV